MTSSIPSILDYKADSGLMYLRELQEWDAMKLQGDKSQGLLILFHSVSMYKPEN